MKKLFKILLILGASLLVLGGAIFSICMSIYGWDFSKVSNITCVSKTYETDSLNIENIVINVDSKDVEFKMVDGDKITVEYYNEVNKKGTVVSELIPSVTGDTLNLKEVKKFALTVSLFSSKNKITVNIPNNKVLSIKVETDTGKVTVGEKNKQTTYSKISVDTDTGYFKVLGNVITKENFKVQLDTGDVFVDGEIECLGNLDFTTDTGKISVNSKISANAISFESDTGKININASISASAISFELDTGDVLCKSAILGENINVSTDTGDITLILKGAKSEYSYFYEISTGKSNIAPYISGSRTIRAKSITGDINISFKE